MQAKDIKVGGHYLANCAGRLVTVRVDRVRRAERGYGRTAKTVTVYDVTNLDASGRQKREFTFTSAAKFRAPAKGPGQRTEDFVEAYRLLTGFQGQFADGSQAANVGRKLFQAWKAAGRPTPAEDWLREHLGDVNPDAGPQFPAEAQAAEGDDSSDPRPLSSACAGPRSSQESAGSPCGGPVSPCGGPTAGSSATSAGVATCHEEGEQGSDPTHVPSAGRTTTNAGAPRPSSGPATPSSLATDEEGEQRHPFPAAPTAPSGATPSGPTTLAAAAPDAPGAETAEDEAAQRLADCMRFYLDPPAADSGLIISENPAGGALLLEERGVELGIPTPDRGVPMTASKKTPTPEQQAILDLIQGLDWSAPGAVVIEAGAGTGKTTTLQMLEQALAGKRGQYTAFNKSLVEESRRKFRHAAVNSTHSLAFRAVGKRYAKRLNGPRVKSAEVAKALGIEDLTLDMGVDDKGQPKRKLLSAGYLASLVVAAIRKFCQTADDGIDTKHFPYIDGIDAPADGRRTYDRNEQVRAYLLPFAQRMWADIADVNGTLPFTHDCYVKLWQLGDPVISADYILLDESQDTAPVFLDILARQEAMVILVGDSAQQIYEWRGAVDAMASFPDAPRRQLSQSFRFGQAVADVANSVLATLDQPTSLRLKGLPSIPSRVEPIADPTCVLCRTNAAAVSRLLNAFGEGKRPHLIGGGADVIAWVEGAQALQCGRAASHPDLACFGDWAEVVAYSAQEDGEDLKLMVKLVNEFGCEPILAALRGMPEEKDADLVISTAHKSKGREWDTVQLAPDFPTASKCQDADRKLLYVAVTRAKLVLDVSQCPYFTGQDAIVIRCTTPADGSQPAAPAPARKAVEGFSWARDKATDSWVVRGPKGASGVVEVVSRDGRRARKTISRVVREFDDAALYAVR